MNKIYIDTSDYTLNFDKSGSFLIEVQKNSQIKINISANLEVFLGIIILNHQVKIEVELGENSKLIMNQLGINSSIDYSCHLLSSSYFSCVDSLISSIDSLNKIKIYQEDSSQAKFLANGINLESNKLYFQMDGIIPKDSFNCVLDEHSKIMNIKAGDSKIIPNLMVSTKEVVANHSAFIGKFDDSIIWYLNSRGLDEKKAHMFLLKSILLGGMELDFCREVFIKILIDNHFFSSFNMDDEKGELF